MKTSVPVCLCLFVLGVFASRAEASLAFLRSMPSEGTWAEWKIECPGLYSPDIETKIRLTAGPVIEREGKRFQTLDVSGMWIQVDEPAPLKARYEVDLDRLQKDGHARAAARVLEAWFPEKTGLRKLSANDREMMVYRVMMIAISDANAADTPVGLKEEPAANYELRLLQGKASTGHWGDGDVPKSQFKAWIGDKVPFGVAKWEITTKMGGEHFTMTSTLKATGRAAPTTTQSTTTRPAVKTTSRPVRGGRR
jgi:hypothetical protein